MNVKVPATTWFRAEVISKGTESMETQSKAWASFVLRAEGVKTKTQTKAMGAKGR